jgi:membrane-bound lytic murein transglycosylase B
MRGSYAGAVGIPQFMPGSTRRFAVDFDGNGRIDLRGSPADAIGSVANYLRAHGWQPGGEVMRPAQVSGERWRAYSGLEPAHTLAELSQAGAAIDGEPGGAATLVELEAPDGAAQVRVGFRNFYVLTRYNRSAFYAAAVHDLALELKKTYVLGR